METAVATLLLVVASVILACSVITYAIVTVEQTISTQNMPGINQLKDAVNNLLNQTGVINGTFPQLPGPSP